MKKTNTDIVLTQLKPKQFYRARDVADELHIDPSIAGSALRELSRGGVIERIKDGNRVVYLTKQESLF